jgi:hypothetical protein
VLTQAFLSPQGNFPAFFYFEGWLLEDFATFEIFKTVC